MSSFSKMDESFIKDIKKHWEIILESEDGNIIEAGTYTDGGVEMSVILHRDHSDSFEKQFCDYVDGFDVDKEIDLYMQDDKYKDKSLKLTPFRATRGNVEDFENHKEWLDDVKFNVMSREITSTTKAQEFLEDYGWHIEIDNSFPQAFVKIEKECGENEVLTEDEFVTASKEIWVASKENDVNLSHLVESWEDRENHNKTFNRRIEHER